MTEKPHPRPQMLLAACAYLGGIFAIQFVKVLVLAVGVSTPDGQEPVTKQIGWFRQDGMSLADAVSVYRIVLTVAVVLAAAGVVFAVYAARGDQVSRVLVTVIAAVFLVVSVSGLIGDDFVSGVLGFVGAVFAAQLWTPVVRSHFRVLAGKEPLVLRVRPEKSKRGKGVVEEQARVDEPVPQPPAEAPVGHPPYGYPQYGYPQQPLASRRPKSVNIAVWTALVGSSVVGVFSGLGLLGLALIGGDYERIVSDSKFAADMMNESGMSYDAAFRLSLALFGVCFAVSLGGLAASLLVLARKRSSEVVLFVMTVVTIIVSVLWFPIGLPWTAAAIVVLVQLRKPESKLWFVKT